MGRAVIRQPQVFLMDEPLSNLDAKLRVQMRGEIEALQKRLAVTTVYVTHDQVEAMTMGDRVAVLRDGLLQQVDTPTNVYDRPANLFVAGFIGSPEMNLAQTTIERRDAGLRVQPGDSDIPVSAEVAAARGLDAWVGKELVVGIRPEDLREREAAQDGGRPTVRGTVERVEALGAHLLAYFPVDASPPAPGGIAAVVTGETLEEALIVGTSACCSVPHSNRAVPSRSASTSRQLLTPSGCTSSTKRRAPRSGAKTAIEERVRIEPLGRTCNDGLEKPGACAEPLADGCGNCRHRRAGCLRSRILSVAGEPDSVECVGGRRRLPHRSRGRFGAEADNDSNASSARWLRHGHLARSHSCAPRHAPAARPPASRASSRVAMRAADRYRIASVTKTFVATVVLQLVAEGKLRLADPVERWLPGVVPNGAAITIRQLLNHTSGLFEYTRDDEAVAAVVANPQVVDATRAWRSLASAALRSRLGLGVLEHELRSPRSRRRGRHRKAGRAGKPGATFRTSWAQGDVVPERLAGSGAVRPWVRRVPGDACSISRRSSIPRGPTPRARWSPTPPTSRRSSPRCSEVGCFRRRSSRR